MKKWVFHVFLFVSLECTAQDGMSINGGEKNLPELKSFQSHPTLRKWLVGSGSLLGYGGSFIFLNRAWYKGFPRSSFHTFNDGKEWLQVDKAGHAWTAYTASRVTTRLWQWAGTGRNNSVFLGTGSSLLYLLSIEYLDGRSSEWGWSWPDVAADLFGAGLFGIQEVGWKEQKLLLKFSGSPKTYQPLSLEQRANQLFGKSLPERILKDYNRQTYWVSGNIRSLIRAPHFPAWLNLAVGYGAEGMFGGFENLARDKNGDISFDRRDIRRYRQWYLAPDIDFSRIKTRSKTLHTILTLVNFKLPAPGLELSRNRVRFRALVL